MGWWHNHAVCVFLVFVCSPFRPADRLSNFIWTLATFLFLNSANRNNSTEKAQTCRSDTIAFWYRPLKRCIAMQKYEAIVKTYRPIYSVECKNRSGGSVICMSSFQSDGDNYWSIGASYVKIWYGKVIKIRKIYVKSWV